MILLNKPGKPLDVVSKRRDIYLQPHPLKLLMNGFKPHYDKAQRMAQPESNTGFRPGGSATQSAMALGLALRMVPSTHSPPLPPPSPAPPRSVSVSSSPPSPAAVPPASRRAASIRRRASGACRRQIRLPVPADLASEVSWSKKRPCKVNITHADGFWRPDFAEASHCVQDRSQPPPPP